jgi:phosphoribosyl-ATP pyrophosphohydrolase
MTTYEQSIKYTNTWLEEYQGFCKSRYVEGLSYQDNIVNCALSLSGELAEYTMAHGREQRTLEAGDCLFYIILLLDFLNLDLQDVVRGASATQEYYHFTDIIAKLGDITKKAFFWGAGCSSKEVYTQQYANVIMYIIGEIAADVKFYNLDVLMKGNMDKLSKRKPVG